MPNKKKKNKNQNPLESVAKAIFANAKEAFYLGANNHGSTPVSSQQAIFIQEKINSLVNNENLFNTRLKKISILDLKNVKNKRQEYIDKKNIVVGLELLNFFYDYSTLKKQFKCDKKIDWNEDWFADLNHIWATSYLEQYRKENGKIFSKEDLEIYGKLRIDGVTDEGEKRKIYFKRTFFDLKAATLHGTGACELMAEFALFEAIRMSETLACSIHYIRFLSAKYEEINAIALGNWPDEDCLVICPWLDKGENLIWKKDLQTTRFKHYLEKDIKVIFKISTGTEMNKWREALATVDFLADTEEKRTIKNRVEKLSEKYQKAFKDLFIKENDAEINSMPIRRLGR